MLNHFKIKNSRILDFSRFLLPYVTGDERIELPLRVLETPVMPFDQSPMCFLYSYFIAHFRGDVNNILGKIAKMKI